MSVIDDDSALLKNDSHFLILFLVKWFACSLSIQLLKRFTTPNHDALPNVDEDDKINQDDNDNELVPAR